MTEELPNSCKDVVKEALNDAIDILSGIDDQLTGLDNRLGNYMEAALWQTLRNRFIESTKDAQEQQLQELRYAVFRHFYQLMVKLEPVAAKRPKYIILCYHLLDDEKPKIESLIHARALSERLLAMAEKLAKLHAVDLSNDPVDQQPSKLSVIPAGIDKVQLLYFLSIEHMEQPQYCESIGLKWEFAQLTASYVQEQKNVIMKAKVSPFSAFIFIFDYSKQQKNPEPFRKFFVMKLFKNYQNQKCYSSNLPNPQIYLIKVCSSEEKEREAPLKNVWQFKKIILFLHEMIELVVQDCQVAEMNKMPVIEDISLKWDLNTYEFSKENVPVGNPDKDPCTILADGHATEASSSNEQLAISSSPIAAHNVCITKCPLNLNSLHSMLANYYGCMQQELKRLERLGEVGLALMLHRFNEQIHNSAQHTFSYVRYCLISFQWLISICRSFDHRKCFFEVLHHATQPMMTGISKWLLKGKLTESEYKKIFIVHHGNDANMVNHFELLDQPPFVNGQLGELQLSLGKAHHYSRSHLNFVWKASINVIQLQQQLSAACSEYYMSIHNMPLQKLLVELTPFSEALLLEEMSPAPLELLEKLRKYLLLEDSKFVQMVIEVLEPLLAHPVSFHDGRQLNNMMKLLLGTLIAGLYRDQNNNTSDCCFLLHCEDSMHLDALLAYRMQQCASCSVGLWFINQQQWRFHLAILNVDLIS